MTTTPDTLFKPEHATTDIETFTNLVIGIQGAPGSGKTASALTFPNPVIALFEKPDLQGLLSLEHLREVKPLLMPFYSAEFVLTKCRIPKSGTNIDVAAAFEKWLEIEAPKLTKEQTLVVDNWTRLQEYFDLVNWTAPNYPTHNSQGKIDEFKPWSKKIDFAEKVSNALVALNCNVVVLFHEVQEREQGTGRLLDKIQPLMQGKFLAKLKSYYQNFYRQKVRVTKDKADSTKEIREYLWQTKASEDFDAKCSKPSLDAYVAANYRSLIST